MNEGQGDLLRRAGPSHLPEPLLRHLAAQSPQDFAGTFPTSRVPSSIASSSVFASDAARAGGDATRPRQAHRHCARRHLRARSLAARRAPARGRALADHRRRAGQLSARSHRGHPHLPLRPLRWAPSTPRGHGPRPRPRGARALLRGRHYCIADDIHDLAIPVLAHRVPTGDAGGWGSFPRATKPSRRYARSSRVFPFPSESGGHGGPCFAVASPVLGLVCRLAKAHATAAPPAFHA